MRAKTFAIVKESIATGGHADAVGSAQNAAVHSSECVQSGAKVIPLAARVRDLSAREAHRIVGRVSLGKHSILYRASVTLSREHCAMEERAHAIDELSTILKKADGPKKTPFDLPFLRCISAAAVDELAIDMCFECKGAGKVRDHDLPTLEGKQPMKACPKCGGARKRRYSDDERLTNLAREVRVQRQLDCETRVLEARAEAEIANELRAHKWAHRMIEGIEQAKGILLEAERIATEETAHMVEKW